MSTIKTNTLTGTTSAGVINLTGEGGSTTTNLQQGLAKAWGNFHEPDPVTLRDNLNVTSLTDNGTGYFTVNITNSMNNDDYVRIGSAGENANTGGNRVLGLRLPATNSFNTITKNTGGTDSDTQDTCVAIFGDLA
tara:strand:- start:24 stop:428 length:405 start_codon:yes stop_codon:yes gene_type:complete